ncbi:sensor histidine kinase [Geomicrobium sp. JSM 1781026]|uniref:sensor histidine kinase n=1 Tax=Geomicrobium sp. JSM 1781026 TaxID=3344580 RepID=UPI0035BF5F33
MWIRLVATLLIYATIYLNQPQVVTSPLFWFASAAVVTSFILWDLPVPKSVFVSVQLLAAIVMQWLPGETDLYWLFPLTGLLFYALHTGATVKTMAVLLSLITIPVLLSTINFLLYGLYATVLLLLVLHTKKLREKEEGFQDVLVLYRREKRQVIEAENTVKQDERARIAREMHDSVGHNLTALMMQLKMLELRDEAPEEVYVASALASESLSQMRASVHELKSDQPKGLGMIIQLIRKLESESLMKISFTTKGGVLSVSLSEEQSVTIYRFVQEGLTNAMRHAYTKQVDITFEVLGARRYVVRVKSGAKDHSMFSEGFGLRQLRERFEALGGTFLSGYHDDQFVIEGSFTIPNVEAEERAWA